jgi:hypothetical protein
MTMTVKRFRRAADLVTRILQRQHGRLTNAHMTPSDSRHGRGLRDVEATTLALDGASLELAAGP